MNVFKVMKKLRFTDSLNSVSSLDHSSKVIFKKLEITVDSWYIELTGIHLEKFELSKIRVVKSSICQKFEFLEKGLIYIYILYSERWKKKLSHSILYFPTSFEHRPLSLIHIWRCRRSTLCRSRWSPYH